MFKMPVLNQVVIAGRLTRDPELKKTLSGMSLVKVNIAVDNFWQKGGQWQKETFFIAVQCWGTVAENFVKRTYKGAPVIVVGRLNIGKWTDSQGYEKTSPEIVAERISVLEWQDEATQSSPEQSKSQPTKNGEVPF